MKEDFEWYAEQRKKLYENLQIQLNEEFDRTHNKIIQDSKLKDKGTLRNINNYRMKLWCDIYLESFKNNINNDCFVLADEALKEFDRKFNI